MPLIATDGLLERLSLIASPCSPPPSPIRYQNAIESWLYASSIVLLVLGIIYKAISDALRSRTLGNGLDIAMLVVLVGSFVGPILWSVRQEQTITRMLDSFSLVEMLLRAEKQIDGPIRERLADGTIRLLSCAWLISADSDQYLGRAASGEVIMRRRQELPEEAFVPPAEAVAWFDRADRSILALSYRWLTSWHPDPLGTALSAMRRFLRSEADLSKCALFWDFASLPQKDTANGQRTAEENGTFKRGIEAMGCFYASMCGTAVVQLKDIPPRPSEYDGRMSVFDASYSKAILASLLEYDVIADLQRFGGTITEIAIKTGEAQVTFATHAQAERCIAALREEGRGACTVYNETAYSRDRGEPFSGWCTFEQGACKLVAGHLSTASRQASKRSVVLPERLVRANASRAKVLDISDGQVRTVDVGEESPVALLEKTSYDIEIAKFVGKGEAETVKQLLAKLEWSMHMAMEQATADHVKSGLTVARVRKPGRGGAGICALLCDVARCLRGRNLSDVDVHISAVDGTELGPSQSCATGSISASPAISQHSPKAHRIVTVEARHARASPANSQHSSAILHSDVTQSVA